MKDVVCMTAENSESGKKISAALRESETSAASAPADPSGTGEASVAGSVLAFDTSNYTTSVALTDLNGKILADERCLLTVKEGERGLRQSHALFQHMENLPRLLKKVMASSSADLSEIRAVAASERPRPVEGSYMPVFRAGTDLAASISALLEIPMYVFSHQEGHIAAVCGAADERMRAVSFHMSGGTGEILEIQGCTPVRRIGGVRDISFGQLIDRTGVALGFSFPAGAALDRIACDSLPEEGLSCSSRDNTKITQPVTGSVRVDDTFVSLSGIETQILRWIEKNENLLREGGDTADAVRKKIIPELFSRISDVMLKLSENALRRAQADTIIFVGGVSASSFLRRDLSRRLEKKGKKAVFGDAVLSSDNACGTARLGAARFLKEISEKIR